MASNDRPIRSTRTREAKVKSKGATFGYDANLNDKWTTQEKQLLLEALKLIPASNISLIQKNYLPKRKLQEIDIFIKRMKNKAPAIDDTGIPGPAKNIKQAPIEAWLEKAEDLTYHDFDYSYIIAQVMSVAGNLEEHDSKNKADDPDWSRLYSYLVSLLRGDPTPDLGPVESVVMLDLIDTLAEQLKHMDTSLQRELMRRKYKLLTVTVDVNNKQASYAAARRALEEDLLETDSLEVPDKASKSPKKRGRKRKGENTSADVRPAKTQLYSINPFCIPVKYLKPKSTRDTNSTPAPVPAHQPSRASSTITSSTALPGSSIQPGVSSMVTGAGDSVPNVLPVRVPVYNPAAERHVYTAPPGDRFRHNHQMSAPGHAVTSHGDALHHVPGPRPGPRMLPPQVSRAMTSGRPASPLQGQTKTKRISIQESQSGTTTIQISDIL